MPVIPTFNHLFRLRIVITGIFLFSVVFRAFIQSRLLLYDREHFYTIPNQIKTFIPVISIFNHLFRLKTGCYGNEDSCFSNLALLYDSWIILDDLKHFYGIIVHSYIILNTSMQFRAKSKQNIPVIPILTISFG